MLRANSGSALLYFYSDKLYNEKGFKIKYRWVAISSVIFYYYLVGIDVEMYSFMCWWFSQWKIDDSC